MMKLAVQHEELTNEELMELEAQRKDKKRQEEGVNEEPEIRDAKMQRGFYFFEKALLVFEAWDLNLGWYRKVAGAVQNASQHYYSIYDEKNRATTQMSLDIF